MQNPGPERTKAYEVTRVTAGARSQDQVILPVEQAVSLIVNGENLFIFYCLPEMIEELATGFLVTQGLISTPKQILHIASDPAAGRITASLDRKAGRAEASSCKTDATFHLPAEVLLEAMKEFRAQATGSTRPMGAHVAAVAQGAKILSIAEDIGRHNAMDKAVGAVVMQGVPLRDKILLTTARVNRDVVLKASRAGFPVVATSRSTTTTAVDLARESSLTIAGFISATGMILFSADWRVVTK